MNRYLAPAWLLEAVLVVAKTIVRETLNDYRPMQYTMPVISCPCATGWTDCRSTAAHIWQKIALASGISLFHKPLHVGDETFAVDGVAVAKVALPLLIPAA